MSTITLGVDLAKNVFSVCEMDGAGHVPRRPDLKRGVRVVAGAAAGRHSGGDGGAQRGVPCHCVREGYKVEALALGNRIRGLLAEFGLVVAKSDVALRRVLADLDTQPALPGELRELLDGLRAHWARLREAVDACSAQRTAHASPTTRARMCAASGRAT